jgi:hypothetical protein
LHQAPKTIALLWGINQSGSVPSSLKISSNQSRFADSQAKWGIGSSALSTPKISVGWVKQRETQQQQGFFWVTLTLHPAYEFKLDAALGA